MLCQGTAVSQRLRSLKNVPLNARTAYYLFVKWKTERCLKCVAKNLPSGPECPWLLNAKNTLNTLWQKASGASNKCPLCLTPTEGSVLSDECQCQTTEIDMKKKAQ